MALRLLGSALSAPMRAMVASSRTLPVQRMVCTSSALLATPPSPGASGASARPSRFAGGASSPRPGRGGREGGRFSTPSTPKVVTELDVTETREMVLARPPPAGDNKFVYSIFEGKRVVKVTRGGRQASMSATVVVGNMQGAIGFASGKSEDLQGAIDKATVKAVKSVVPVPRFANRTIYHPIHGTYGATTVHLRPTRPGKGLKCHRGIMAILRLAGITDVSGNAIGVTTNMPNLIRATISALQSQAPAERTGEHLGKTVVLLDREDAPPTILKRVAPIPSPIDYAAIPAQQRAYRDWQFSFPRTPTYANLKEARQLLDAHDAKGKWDAVPVPAGAEDLAAWLKQRPAKLFPISDDILDRKIFANDPTYKAPQ